MYIGIMKIIHFTRQPILVSHNIHVHACHYNNCVIHVHDCVFHGYLLSTVDEEQTNENGRQDTYHNHTDDRVEGGGHGCVDD